MHGALLLLMAAAAGAFALWLRQPVLIAYIAMGIVAGPAVLGVVTAHDQIDLLAQVGVAVLLFVVGLKLDLQHIRHIGPVALATGLGQLSFTIVIGFFLILAMGKGWVEALYVAVALTFSSTIIIVKLLSDKREIDSLHGRIAVGFLIVQDLAVVIAMMVMSALRGDAGEGSLLALAGSLTLRIGIAGLGLYLLMRYVLPRVVDRMAQSQELLLIFAIAWGTGLARWANGRASRRRPAPSSPAFRWPRRIIAMPSTRGSPASATSCCCSSSSTSAPSSTSPPSAGKSGRQSSCRCSC
jgi:Kef-type K+ transport system membrane component KefB